MGIDPEEKHRGRRGVAGGGRPGGTGNENGCGVCAARGGAVSHVASCVVSECGPEAPGEWEQNLDREITQVLYTLTYTNKVTIV